ncbi:MAG: hypothetical protein HOW73_19550 [Polyangiaceae bacterium]|nr:hypothetical protein [Polyangiaceae bacterium]
MPNTTTRFASGIGLGALGYYLPPREEQVDELAAAGRTRSSADRLRALGFQTVRVSDVPVEQLARLAVDDLRARSGFDLSKIDLILFGGGMGTSAVVDPGEDYGWGRASNPLPLFKFTGTRLQIELGLSRVPVMGVGQMACSAFQGCVRLARALITAESGIDHVLCVAADRFPTGANREVVYNLMSDGACAGVVSRGAERNRILSVAQETRGVYWDCEASHDQIVAAYFPLIRETMLDALRDAGLQLDELDLLIPHNVSAKTWEIMARVLGLPPEKIFTANIPRFGHAVASDNVANHLDAQAAGRVRPGDKVAWFVMGFGAHWNCTVLEA